MVYRLFAMNENGVEMLVSDHVKAQHMKAAVDLVLQDGLIPRLERIKPDQGTVCQQRIQSYLT